MNKCPIPHGMYSEIAGFSDRIYAQYGGKDTVSGEIEGTYEKLGEIIDEIFTPAFFDITINHAKYATLTPTEFEKILIARGDMMILRYFTEKLQSGEQLTNLPGMKMYPTNMDEVIRMGWAHAVGVGTTLIGPIVSADLEAHEYEKQINEARKIFLKMSSMHLSIEGAVAKNLERILATGYTCSRELYDSVIGLRGFDLPKVGCPAVFFGEKRVGRSLFDWIEHHLREYSTLRGAEEKDWRKKLDELCIALRAKITTLLR